LDGGPQYTIFVKSTSVETGISWAENLPGEPRCDSLHSRWRLRAGDAELWACASLLPYA